MRCFLHIQIYQSWHEYHRSNGCRALLYVLVYSVSWREVRKFFEIISYTGRCEVIRIISCKCFVLIRFKTYNIFNFQWNNIRGNVSRRDDADCANLSYHAHSTYLQISSPYNRTTNTWLYSQK